MMTSLWESYGQGIPTLIVNSRESENISRHSRKTLLFIYILPWRRVIQVWNSDKLERFRHPDVFLLDKQDWNFVKEAK